MARLYLFAEGPTEQTFADVLLKPHLANYGVYLHNPILIAHCRKKGRVHRGGGRNYLPMRNDVIRFLKQEKSDDVFFSTMIDLYALHGDFPGRKEAGSMSHDPEAKVRFLEESWAADVGDPRFLPYLQLHEFEGLLFADLSALESFYPDAGGRIARLQSEVSSFKTPELIDDGPATAPSKRIRNHFGDYAKSVMGPQMAQLIGLTKIRNKCPHFDQWLERLEELASGGI
jgi:hypothetical protein